MSSSGAQVRSHDPSPVTGRARRVALPVLALLLLGAALFGAGLYVGSRTAGPAAEQLEPRRDFMFQVLGLPTANQGGNTINLFFRYRYATGLAEGEIPDYRKMRDDTVNYLATTDLSTDPYWETLNTRLCARLRDGYPLNGISCQLQVIADDTTGYRSSVETFGGVEPLSIPSPPTGR